MNHRIMLGLALCLGTLACREGGGERVEVRFPGDTVGLVRPRLLDSVTSVVHQLNAIIIGQVRDISTDYDRCEGPRTILHLTNVRSMLGAPHADPMEIRLFGGPLANGRYATISESPRYVSGARYLLFLFNTDWRFSPVISDYALRIERVLGRDILIAPNGQAVTGLSPLALETNTRMLFLPEGKPGVGVVRVSPTPVASFLSCDVNPDGTPRCPRLPTDTTPHREVVPEVPAWSPRPATAEDTVHTLSVDDLVSKIDSVADKIGVSPGGYYADHPRLECWNATPTQGPAQ